MDRIYLKDSDYALKIKEISFVVMQITHNMSEFGKRIYFFNSTVLMLISVLL